MIGICLKDLDLTVHGDTPDIMPIAEPEIVIWPDGHIMGSDEFAKIEDRYRALRGHAAHLTKGAIVCQCALDAEPEIAVRSCDKLLDHIGWLAQGQRKFLEGSARRDATKLVKRVSIRSARVNGLGEPEIVVRIYGYGIDHGVGRWQAEEMELASHAHLAQFAGAFGILALGISDWRELTIAMKGAKPDLMRPRCYLSGIGIRCRQRKLLEFSSRCQLLDGSTWLIGLSTGRPGWKPKIAVRPQYDLTARAIWHGHSQQAQLASKCMQSSTWRALS